METAIIKPETQTLIQRFDDLAREIVAIEAGIAAEKKIVDAKYDELQKLVEKHGTMPENATKSLRIDGTTHFATVSFPVKTTIDEKRVLKVRDVLKQLGEPRIFGKLFITETSYILSPRFTEIVSKLPDQVKRLAKRVIVTEPKNPSIKLEPKKAPKASKRSKKAAA
jgi:hypothetical protein